MSEDTNTGTGTNEPAKSLEVPYTEVAAPTANQVVRHGFGGLELAGEGSGTAALVARQRANIESRFVMAMRRPRNPALARSLILEECKRPGFAEKGFYRVPRGGKTIEGLSIRMAEAALRCWGNAPAEAVTIYESDLERIVECTVTDLESNVTWSEQITVKKTVERSFLKDGQAAIRSRVNSSGKIVHLVEATDDDVTMKANSMISKSLRKLILRLIPGNIQDEALALCKKIFSDKSAQDPNAAKTRMVDAFAELGILADKLEEFLGVPMAQVTLDHIRAMGGVHAAIREGELTWPEALAHREELLEEARKAAEVKRAAAAAATPNAATPNAAAPNADAKKSPAPTPAKPDAKAGKGNAGVKEKMAGAKTSAAETTDQKIEKAKAEAPKPPSEPKTNAEPAPDIKPAPTDKPAPAPTAPASISDPNAEPPEEEAKPASPPQGAPPKLELVTRSPSDYEFRACAMCGDNLETLKTDPPGSICEACANS